MITVALRINDITCYLSSRLWPFCVVLLKDIPQWDTALDNNLIPHHPHPWSRWNSVSIEEIPQQTYQRNNMGRHTTRFKPSPNHHLYHHLYYSQDGRDTPASWGSLRSDNEQHLVTVYWVKDSSKHHYIMFIIVAKHKNGFLLGKLT